MLKINEIIFKYETNMYAVMLLSDLDSTVINHQKKNKCMI